MTRADIRNLKKLGYEPVSKSKPRRFSDGGQFAGGYWEISEEEAAAQLEQARRLNKVWQRQFNKDYYDLE